MEEITITVTGKKSNGDLVDKTFTDLNEAIDWLTDLYNED